MSAAIQHPEAEFELGAVPVRIGGARLKVRDLAAVSGFYQDVLGLVPVGQSVGRVVLGVPGKPLLELVGDPGLMPLDRREAGLFHTTCTPIGSVGTSAARRGRVTTPRRGDARTVKPH